MYENLAVLFTVSLLLGLNFMVESIQTGIDLIFLLLGA